jgi:MFS family permease
MMFFTGFCLVITNAALNTLVQTIADEDKRGRALSLLMMCFLGLVPIGGLIFGELARRDRLGPRETVIAAAVGLAIAVFVFGARLPRLRRHVRPILIRRGILPPIAHGLESSAELSVPPEQAS